jgi:hypothetical protein
MVQITKVKNGGYTVIGTRSEDEVAVMVTHGQSGHFAIRIIRTAVDGGYWDGQGVEDVLFIPYGVKKSEELGPVVREALGTMKYPWEPEDVETLTKAVVENSCL